MVEASRRHLSGSVTVVWGCLHSEGSSDQENGGLFGAGP